jgi:TolB-like protein/Tfp pilus assembly protein PilF
MPDQERPVEFTLDIREERLFRDGRPVRLTGKAFSLLKLFAKSPNRLLTKDTILENLWNDIFVTEALVKEYVHDLRRALGDDARHPQFIETVRGRGYRFLGGIEVVDVVQEPGRLGGRNAAPPALAVLPFANVTGGERWGRFCRGLCEDLIVDLARIPDLIVMAKSAAFAYEGRTVDVRTIGRELSVAYVLDGGIQANDRSVRVNVQLSETSGGRMIWAERYTRTLTDFFKVQEDIVDHVVAAVGGLDGRIVQAERARIRRRPPQTLEAYELYLRGHELVETLRKEETLEALALLKVSLAADPNNARAWVVFSWACHHISNDHWAGDPARYLDMAHDAVTKAVTLDPRDPMVLLQFGALCAIRGQRSEAIEAIERALDVGGNQADSLALLSRHLVLVMDDPARAMAVCERSFALNPHPVPFYFMALLRVAYFAREFARARRAAARAPDNMQVRLFELMSAAMADQAADAASLAAAFRQRFPSFDPDYLVRTMPISAPRAKALYYEGIERAGLA